MMNTTNHNRFYLFKLASRLSVEILAEYMNMSASTLYRKVKAITSLAPNDFIRLYRLKKAAELLTTHDYRITPSDFIKDQSR